MGEEFFTLAPNILFQASARLRVAAGEGPSTAGRLEGALVGEQQVRPKRTARISGPLPGGPSLVSTLHLARPVRLRARRRPPEGAAMINHC